MADIELVIKIPEVFYESLRNTDVIIAGRRNGKLFMSSVIFNAIVNGTLLPKGHGDLIDRKALMDNGYQMEPVEMWYGIKYTPTIIEADKTERGEAE